MQDIAPPPPTTSTSSSPERKKTSGKKSSQQNRRRQRQRQQQSNNNKSDNSNNNNNNKPKRPLSAYNIFFQHERQKILGDGSGKRVPTTNNSAYSKRSHRKAHGKIGFADLARQVATKWNNLDPKTKSSFDRLAAVEKARYEIEIEMWNKNLFQAQKEKTAEACTSAASAATATAATTATFATVAAASAIQPEALPVLSMFDTAIAGTAQAASGAARTTTVEDVVVGNFYEEDQEGILGSIGPSFDDFVVAPVQLPPVAVKSDDMQVASASNISNVNSEKPGSILQKADLSPSLKAMMASTTYDLLQKTFLLSHSKSDSCSSSSNNNEAADEVHMMDVHGNNDDCHPRTMELQPFDFSPNMLNERSLRMNQTTTVNAKDTTSLSALVQASMNDLRSKLDEECIEFLSKI